MVLFIIFLVLTLVGVLGLILATINSDDEGGWILYIIIFGVSTIWAGMERFHSPKYDYMSLLAERNALEQTLENLRDSGNPYETAVLFEKISEFNVRLEKEKVDNKNWVWRGFIDDRVEQIEIVK